MNQEVNGKWTVLIQHFSSLLTTQSDFTLHVTFKHIHTLMTGAAHQGVDNIHTPSGAIHGSVSCPRTHININMTEPRIELSIFQLVDNTLYLLHHSCP